MPTCNPSLISGETGGFRLRLWPVFSTAAALRRKLLETLICGSAHSKEISATGSPISPRDRDRPRRDGSERLSELMKADALDDSVDMETKRKIETLQQLESVASRLHNASADNVPEAAAEVRRLAKDDAEARETLAMLGVIPPLVGMLDSGDPELHIPVLYALLNLGIGNDLNKTAIVKAGAVHKMLSLIESGSPETALDAIVANFLGLSALDSNKLIIGTSGAIPFLIKRFKCHNVRSPQSRQDALRAILNLSIAAPNVPYLIDSDPVPCLLSAVGDMDVSERVLSVMSNLVSAPEGRRAVSRAGDVFCILVDVLNWSDSPGCQEKAVYILMLMAHKARGGDRAAMMEAGIMSALLELTLLGSALAQRRASRVLEILNLDKGKHLSEGFGGGGGSGLSAEVKGVVDGDSGEEAGMSAERSAVRQLVKQSLQSNMRRIVRRANLPPDFAPSDHFKTLTATSTSKSLPF